MKMKILMMAGILLMGSVAAAAENKDFYASGQIVDGEVWNMVNIYNDDTFVDMSGGLCDYVVSHDESTFNMTGGEAQIEAMDYSTANISGGILAGADASSNGIINFSGTANTHNLGASNFGIVHMTSGTVKNIGAVDSGVVNLSGGIISDKIFASLDSIVNIFGYDLSKYDAGGTYGNGWVSGFWADDSAFAVDLYGADTYSHINLIPEPCSILLFGLGFFVLRKRNKP